MSKEPEYMNAISGLIQYFVVGWETKQFDYEKAFNIVEQALNELEELKKNNQIILELLVKLLSMNMLGQEGLIIVNKIKNILNKGDISDEPNN